MASGYEPAGGGVPFDTSRPHTARVANRRLGALDQEVSDGSSTVAGQTGDRFVPARLAPNLLCRLPASASNGGKGSSALEPSTFRSVVSAPLGGVRSRRGGS